MSNAILEESDFTFSRRSRSIEIGNDNEMAWRITMPFHYSLLQSILVLKNSS